MESKKATTVLSDIMQKLSSIGSTSKEVKEEAVELSAEAPVVSEEAVDKIEMSAETITEDKVEEEVSVELAEDSKELAVEAEEVVEEVEEIVEEGLDEEKYVSREEFEAAIAEIKAMVGELSLSYTQEKVEMSEQIETLSKEPASEPIAHSPEAEVQVQKKYLYSQNKGMSTMQRVLNKMNY